jgi:hypothetical protein
MRRLLLSLALALSLSALYASPALARRRHHHGNTAPEGAQKAPIFSTETISCETGAFPASMTTFGFAILNTPGDETTITGVLALKGVAPNTTYRVEVISGFPTCAGENVGDLTTNKQGNGTLEFTIPRLAAKKFSVNARSGELSAEEFHGSPAVELD